MRRLTILPVLWLAACAAQGERAETAAVLEQALADHRASVASVGAPAPAAGAARTPARQVSTAPAMAGELIGQTLETLLRVLGEPRLRRDEGGAEIWHYQAEGCHLDVVLYSDGGPRPVLRVAHAAARADGTARRGEAACLRDIGRGAARGAPERFAGA